MLSVHNNNPLSPVWKYLVLLENRFQPCMTLGMLLLWTLEVPNWIHSQNGWLSLKRNPRLLRAICSHSIALNSSSSLPCIDTVLKSRRFSCFAFISWLLTLYWKVTNSFWRLSTGLGWVLSLGPYWKGELFICGCSWISFLKQIFALLYFFYSFTCISGRPDAKDQVRLTFLQAVALYHIAMMAIFMWSFECKVMRCFRSSKRFLMHFPWSWNNCSRYLLTMWASYPEPLCCKVDWISFNILGANSSCCSQLLWSRWCKY